MANAYGLPGGQVVELQSFYRANVVLGQTKRQRDATIADLYYLSKQYDGLREWNDKTVPLRQRKPRIIVPLFRETIEAVDRFIWSGSRFPKASITATKSDDDDTVDVGPVIDSDQAEQLNVFLSSLIRSGRLSQCVREYTITALKSTSAAVIVGVNAGYVNCYVHSGKDCTPTFDDLNPRRLASIEIKYQHPRDEKISGSGATRQVWYWYRRVVDAYRDVVYQETRVTPGVQEPEWVEDPIRSVDHGLGFCPAIWIRTFGDCSDPIDGKPLIDPALYPMLDAISYTVSQRQRAIEYGLDPQPYRKGVPPGERDELRKNPGNIWDLPEGAEVGYLEARGSGSDVASKHLDDLSQAFRDAVGVVKSRPEIGAGTISGVALELVHAPLIALASDLRADLGDVSYVDLLCMVLRVVTVCVQEKGMDIWIPGVKKSTALLQSAQMQGPWLDPPIVLDWPPFFESTEQDNQVRVGYTNLAVQGGLISAKTGTRQVSRVFGVENPEAEHENIDDEKDEAVNREGSSLMSRPSTIEPVDKEKVDSPLLETKQENE